MGPANDLLLFHKGQREQDSIASHSPDDFEWLLRIGPFGYGVAIEKMRRENRYVSASIDISIEIESEIPNDRPFCLYIENIEIANDRRNVGGSVVGLGIGGGIDC